MKSTNKIIFIIEIFIILLILASSLVAISPYYDHTLGRDDGVYRYVSWRIVEGETLYIDIWDHKPPIFYLFNVAAFKILGISDWSIWFLLVTFTVLIFFLFFKLTNKLYNKNIAFISSIILLFSLIQINISNTPELYSIIFQLIIIYLFIFSDWKNKKKYLFIIGLLVSVLFFTKQSTIGVAIVLFFWLIFEVLIERIDLKKFLTMNIQLLLGFSIPTLVVLFYFWKNLALSSFFSSSFIYNLSHSASSIIAKFETMIFGLDLLRNVTGLSIFAIVGWLFSCYSLFLYLKIKSATENQEKILKLNFLIAIGIPVEIFLAGFTGYKYPHYFLTCLPILALSFAGLTNLVMSQLKLNNSYFEKPLYFGLLITIITTQISYSSRSLFWPFVDNKIDSTQIQLIEYIETYTKKNDFVLFLGAESGINYLSKRRSPSRFVYQYPLTNKGYSNQEMFDDFINDIKNNKPEIIIDTKNSKILTDPKYNSDILYSIFISEFFFEKCFKDVSIILENDWDIYKCNW